MSGSNPDDIRRPTRPPRRKWPWGAGLLVLVVIGVFVFQKVTHEMDECGPGVKKTGPRDECIGVSDGSYAFRDSLKPVMDKIRDENRRVAKSGRKWVSVAYVEPLSSDPSDESAKYQVLEELKGAYLAQRQLNDNQLGGVGDLPQIRLLVANIGERSEQWKPLTDQLIAMAHGGKDHLVAVAGFGTSRGGTLKAVDALRLANVPMMGATVTADGLSSSSKVGFFRVSAPNSDQASGAAAYLAGRQKAKHGYKVLVIRDRNEDDIYNTSLYKDFMTAARTKGLALMDSEVQYASGIDGISNAFSAVAQQVCYQKPDAIFFAGRGANLRGFIIAMSAAGRRCPVTVLTGDDAVGVYYGAETGDATVKQFQRDWAVSRVTAFYTALGHPELADKLYRKADNPYPGFLDLYRRTFGGTGEDELQDGQATLGHDAVWTLGVAIHQAAGDDGSATVNAESALSQLVTGVTASGVTGPIQLDSDGNPHNKPMALVRLQPEGRYDFEQVIKP
ncbi:ABC transporter substrate-binding protein [Streptomyces guryensis]|uniref:ABC transporter substrate-binding protein n=1 Tax=Streptomyces guryensis TaxID=2886947 RepID=A0A9Q3Z9U0_9ACTN|nr:ABC transporter substrate-binding protein [Streptomyces guryensis]MCD9880138.1 ABC transporter substrate-binding protein [Streptomyces guryensis]